MVMKDRLSFVFGHAKRFTEKRYFEETQKTVNTEFTLSLDSTAHKLRPIWK